jgi:hypothetical protein
LIATTGSDCNFNLRKKKSPEIPRRTENLVCHLNGPPPSPCFSTAAQGILLKKHQNQKDTTFLSSTSRLHFSDRITNFVGFQFLFNFCSNFPFFVFLLCRSGKANEGLFPFPDLSNETMNSPRVELPDFDKFAVSFDELLQKGITVKVQKGNGNGKGGKGGGVTAKRSQPHLILDPATFRERYPWTDIPSPATSIHGEEVSSTKELEVVPRPPLYKDKKRVVVFVGLMLAWLFVSKDLPNACSISYVA